MKKINDFGEKIGGAKKDLWACFHELSAEEQDEMARKDILWKKGKTELPEEIQFWQNEMRKAVKPRPETDAEGYVKFCFEFKADVEACTCMDGIADFYQTAVLKYMDKLGPCKWRYRKAKYPGYFDAKKVLRYADNQKQIRLDCMAQEKYRIFEAMPGDITSEPRDGRFANKVHYSGITVRSICSENWKEMSEKDGNLFLAMKGLRLLGAYTSRDKAEDVIAEENGERKKKERFLPPHLSNIVRDGSDYRFFRMGDGNVLMSRYGLRGGEFGNWATAKDRLCAVNMAYDAFEDLRGCLGVTAKDISLDGKLAIAFGARGRGNAMAHYEPLRNVINITRMRGAGSLAHEWGHALDMYVGLKFGLNGFMTKSVNSTPEAAKHLISSFRYRPDGCPTDFYTNSKKFDDRYSKAGNGYWSSNVEMFARAFACYVLDKLEGRRSDYLAGHAECAVSGDMAAFPIGEERTDINSKFDVFFAYLKAEGILHDAASVTKMKPKGESISFFEGSKGQLMFC